MIAIGYKKAYSHSLVVIIKIHIIGQREELRSDPPVPYLNNWNHGQNLRSQDKLSLLRSNSLKIRPQSMYTIKCAVQCAPIQNPNF